MRFRYLGVSRIFALVLAVVLTGLTGCKVKFKSDISLLDLVSTSPVVADPAPTVSLTSYSGGQVVAAGSSINITWSSTDTDLTATPITIEYSMNSGAWTTLVGPIANTGTTPWTVPSDPDGTLYKFRVTVTDLASQTGTSTGTDITIDNAAPVFTAASFVINGGVSPSLSNTISIDLNVVDTQSVINFICFKDNNTAPTSTDACWQTVATLGAAPAKNITLSGAFFTLDYVPAAYTVYSWAKDSFGNISTLTAAGAGTLSRDKQNITYNPGIPATVQDVISSKTNTPSSPPTFTEMTAAFTDDVFIKWNITDDKAIPAGSVSLYFTTDETNFTLIASGLNNAANGACGVGSGTGCYVWPGSTAGKPNTSYYRIRVGITDSDNLTSYGSGNLINAGNFRLIAGNTDDGRQGSAQAAFFNPETYNDISDHKSLAVSQNGSIYYNDRINGLLKIDPVTRGATVFLRNTGTRSGDGGLVSAATAKKIHMIALDFSNRLLIWDYDRIRRVDLATGIITNFIGGGASTADTVAPGSIQLAPIVAPGIRDSFAYATMLMDPLPNGDLIFRSEGGWPLMTGVLASSGMRFRKFTNSTNTVTSIYPQGTGAESDSARVLSGSNFMYGGFSFDPLTSAITFFTSVVGDFIAGNWTNIKGMTFNSATGNSNGAGTHAPASIFTYSVDAHFYAGKDGKLYQFSGRASSIHVYNNGTNTWTALANGLIGFCVDGTLLSSCNLRLQDLFVTPAGRMYLVDNRLIRYVDNGGRIQTIFGQSYYGGSGGQAISVRLGDADWIEQRNDGKLIVVDRISQQIWEMTVGGVINRIAGNGSVSDPSLAPLAINTGLPYKRYSSDRGFTIDPATGEVYLMGAHFFKLDRGTGKWVIWLNTGTGSLCYSDPLADGTANAKFTGTSGSVNCAGTNINIFGYDGTNILATLSSYYGSINHNPFLKLYNLATKTQTHLMGGLIDGSSNPMSGWCADGTGDTCLNFPLGTLSQRQTWDSVNSRWLMAANTSRTIKAFPPGGVISTYTQSTAGHAMNGFAIRSGAPDFVYYCNGNDGLLYKHTVGGGTVNLPFGTSSITCTSDTVNWDAARNTVIFGITQNGLSGVAEYYDP